MWKRLTVVLRRREADKCCLSCHPPPLELRDILRAVLSALSLSLWDNVPPQLLLTSRPLRAHPSGSRDDVHDV